VLTIKEFPRRGVYDVAYCSCIDVLDNLSASQPSELPEHGKLHRDNGGLQLVRGKSVARSLQPINCFLDILNRK
jgi:hypothetical protein